MQNLKDLWEILREDPQNKDIIESFNRACTPYNVHLLIQDMIEENDRLERRVRHLEGIISQVKEAVK